MPCLLALMAFFTPRLVIALLVCFTSFMGVAYRGVLWPLLGFFFMPLTTLIYAAAMNWEGSVSGIYLVGVVLAVLADLGLVGGGFRLRRLLPF
jgi:hypothetical protein